MSADNWTDCPRCVDKANHDHRLEVERVNALYGKVPVEEFERERAALRAPELDATFREDYEIYGAKTGTVRASYRGSCTSCGLTFSFEVAEDFYERAEVAVDA